MYRYLMRLRSSAQRHVLSAAIAGAAFGLAGCGGGNDPPAAPIAITTQILSDSAFDGDIQQTSATSFSVTQGMSSTVQSVFAGINPNDLTEFRAFLDFPLSGPAGVPADALIDSAFLDIVVSSLQPSSGTLPLLIELVSLVPPTLYGTDFDRTLQPPLASIRVNPALTPSDIGASVSIDVTALMVQAQQSKLQEFQIRILEDLGSSVPVLVEINDSTGANRMSAAPVLTVTYF